MTKKIDDDFISNDGIIFVNEYSNNVTLFTDESSILGVDLNKINLDSAKMILKLLFMSDLWLGVINANHLKNI